VLGEDGKYYGRIWTFRDITERKRVEGHLFQSQKLETVGKLAGGIAHEFNSIMTTVIGHGELLLRDLPRESPLAKNAAEIKTAASRAATLTHQLLAFGRKQMFQLETLDLNAVLAGMENMLRHLMKRGAELRLDLGAGLKTVRADPGQIEQVVVNMAMNAAEAMPDGGCLTIQTANVSVNAGSLGSFPEPKAGDYVMLAIVDTGVGMRDEVKARVFEPFFSTKGVGKGTGLGLATCHGIIKQSGGHVAVESQPGRGTTFRIYLPQVEQGADLKISVPAKTRVEMPRGKETILMVENDPSLREMASALLGRLGYTVHAAADGTAAMTLLRRSEVEHVDMLFTDVAMPQMSGRELASLVRALHPDARILFTSAYRENGMGYQSVPDEGTLLLQKPFTPSVLAHKVRELLDCDR
jgi:nitrogen-specific signal transduction histidine kinase